MAKLANKWSEVLIFLFLLTLAFGVSAAWSQPEFVTIGVLVPQEENPLYLSKLKNAYQIAIQETLGRGGSEVRFFVQVVEYPREAAKLKEVLTQAINTKKIKVLVGGFSASDSQAISEIAAKNSLPYLSIAFPTQVNKSEWVFYLQPPAELYVSAFKGFVTEKAKAKNLAVLYEDSPFGLALYKSIQEMAVKNSWSLAAFIDSPSRAMTTKGFFAQLQSQPPDILLMIYSSTEAIFMLRQAQELNVNPKAFVGVGPVFGLQEMVDPAMKQSDYLFVLGPWAGSSKPKSGARFSEVYQERFGYAPHQWEALGYSAVRIVADAVLKAESNSPKKIREALATLKREAPYGGEVRFGEIGGSLNQNRGESTVAQWQKGKLSVVYPDKYQEAKPLLPTPAWSERK